MDYTEVLIIALMVALAGVSYLIYRVYIKPRRRRNELPKETRRNLGL